MTTFSQNQISNILVGKDVAITTGAMSNLNNGEIGVFTPGGTRYTTAAADAEDPFILALGRGTTDSGNRRPLVSEMIRKSMVEKVVVRETVATQEQIDYIGYNGTSGSIEAINDNFYRIRLNLKEYITSNHGGVYVKDAIYKSDSTATQVEIANGLAVSLVNNFLREPDEIMLFERVTDSTTTASTSGNITVTHGSNTVTAATDIDNGGLVVGDYLVLSSVAYKVTSLDTTNQIATLDTPYQGSSGTVTDANASFITAANAAAGNWGIKLTGVALPFVLGKQHYRKMRWETTLDDFGTTNLDVDGATNSQAALEGSGTYNQIAEMEWGLNGNHGEFLRMGEPNIHSFLQMADSAETGGYDMLEIIYKDTLEGLVNTTTAKKHLILAIDAGKNTLNHYALDSELNGIMNVLEDLLAGVPVATSVNTSHVTVQDGSFNLG